MNSIATRRRTVNQRTKVLGAVLPGAAIAYLVAHAVLRSTNDGWSGAALMELPVADTENAVLAVILSGDGGWADLDRQVGEAFQQHGVATLAFDCLKYF